MEVRTVDLVNDITLVDSGYTGYEVAAVYLIIRETKCAIIETGTTHSVPMILEVLRQKGLQTTDVEYVMPTHVHLDHAGGASELMRQCVNARLVVHPFGARHLIDPSRLIAGATAVYGEERFEALYGQPGPIDASRVIEAGDGFELDFDGRPLTFLDTPGHARHHYCIHDPLSEGIFTGDTFGLAYPKLETATGPFLFATTTPVQFDPQAMLQSIERLLNLNPQRIYLTHFGMIEPTPAVVDELKRSINQFVTIAEGEADHPHRLVRIQQQIESYLLKRLQKRGCKLSPEQINKLIEMDCRLNAQGLDIWLSRRSG